jgi:hypothetical protein
LVFATKAKGLSLALGDDAHLFFGTWKDVSSLLQLL